MRLIVDACNTFGIYILEKNLPEEYRQRLYNKLFALCEKEAELIYKRMKVDIWSQHFAHEVAEKKLRCCSLVVHYLILYMILLN